MVSTTVRPLKTLYKKHKKFEIFFKNFKNKKKNKKVDAFKVCNQHLESFFSPRIVFYDFEGTKVNNVAEKCKKLGEAEKSSPP